MRLPCPPYCCTMCRVRIRIIWQTHSTSKAKQFAGLLKFAGFHNHSPLLTMFRLLQNFISTLSESQTIKQWLVKELPGFIKFLCKATAWTKDLLAFTPFYKKKEETKSSNGMSCIPSINTVQNVIIKQPVYFTPNE
mgnify:CR=1 FL=1